MPFDGNARRTQIIRAAFLSGFVVVLPVSASAQSIVGAVLPSSRSVQVGAPATAFATIINAAPGTAVGCGIALLSTIPATFSYQTTDPSTNQVTGSPNTPVSIAPGAAQSYVFAITPTGAFPPTDVQLSFDCSNTSPAPITSGLNTLLLSASVTPIPDIVALGATVTNDGVAAMLSEAGTTAFSVATVNVGAGAIIIASVDTGAASLPVTLSICPTNPTTGACLTAPASTVATTINAGATLTFGVFVTGHGVVAFDPAHNRVFVRFTDATGTVRGATSVATRTPPSATIPDIRGNYRGTGSTTQFNCQNPLNNGTFGVTISALTISAQTGANFSGSGTAITAGLTINAFSLIGSVTADGQINGTFTTNLFIDGFFVGSTDGTLTGTLSGNTLTANIAGRFRLGERCSVTGVYLVSR